MSFDTKQTWLICNNCGENNLDDAYFCEKCGNKLKKEEKKQENYRLKKKRLTNIINQYWELVIGLFLIIEAIWVLLDPGLTAFRVFFYMCAGAVVSVFFSLLLAVIITFFAILYSPSKQMQFSTKHAFGLLGLWGFLSIVGTIFSLLNQEELETILLDSFNFNAELFIRRLSEFSLIIAGIIFPIGVILVYRKRFVLIKLLSR
ncbi:MAG: zinc ribbon domain-containing protein [Candidatus Hodarchaeales archaeon]